MLWLHFGVPKTGTTALQSFLRLHADALSDSGLHYIKAGRRAPGKTGRPGTSHNQMVFDITKGGKLMEMFRKEITEEYYENKGKSCVLSSEMFYMTNYHRLAEAFSDIPPDQIRIVYYCRRYDDYFESEYKQHAKNGKITIGATAHIKQKLAAMRASPELYNYSGRAARIRAAFPQAEICPQIYDRADLTNGNLIDDVLQLLGTPLPKGLSTAAISNPSLSRVGSEAFGVLTRIVGRRISRQIRRGATNEPVMQGRHDVLEASEREEMNELLTASDAQFHATYFPEREHLFKPLSFSDAERDFRRDTPQDMASLQQAMDIILRLALEHAKTPPPQDRPRRRRRLQAAQENNAVHESDDFETEDVE